MSEKFFQLILKGKSQMTEKLDKLERVRLIISLCDWDERLSQIFILVTQFGATTRIWAATNS